MRRERGYPIKLLYANAGISPSTLRSLIRRGYVHRCSRNCVTHESADRLLRTVQSYRECGQTILRFEQLTYSLGRLTQVN